MNSHNKRFGVRSSSTAAYQRRRRANLIALASVESLECRRLLDANDPVIVLCEMIQPSGDILDSNGVGAHLLHRPGEYVWDAHQADAFPPPWNNVDGDGNGYADDVYGWNFIRSNPDIADQTADAGHGAIAASALAGTLDSFGGAGSRVKMMFVVGASMNAGTAGLQYVLDSKAAGINIVAIGAVAAPIDRAGAEQLNSAGIVIMGGIDNRDINWDPYVGDESLFYWSGSPRSGIQKPALDNVLPVTTLPSNAPPNGTPTSYGQNTTYFSTPTMNQQSFATPSSAAYLGAAVQAYQDAHSGQNPTVQQIKRAMMSGVDYVSELNERTVTHDYVGGARAGGGVLNISKVISAINSNTPALTNLAISSYSQGYFFGTQATLNLQATGSVSNWTIDWGDNSESQVVAGSTTSVQHSYPGTSGEHHYFPTAFAVSATDGQVYLAGNTEIIMTDLAATSGHDEYVIGRQKNSAFVSRTNSNGTVTVRNPTNFSSLNLVLNTGNDIATVNLGLGDPLTGTTTSITASASGTTLSINGKLLADTATFDSGTATINGNAITDTGIESIRFDGVGSNNVVTVNGGPSVGFPATQNMASLTLAANAQAAMLVDGNRVLFTKALSIGAGASLDLNDNDLILDYTGASQLAAVQSLITSARNGGTWTGAGLTSSSAKNMASHITTLGAMEATDFKSVYGPSATFDGQTIDNTAVLVKYTYNGDTDFNGRVDGDDYAHIDFAYTSQGTAGNIGGWLNGDSDASGQINFDDYALIDAAFNAQGGVL